MRRKARVRLTLHPGERGTKKLTAEYGEKLVAVRYRYDAEAQVRYTTVEIIVDEQRWQPEPELPDRDRLMGVRVARVEVPLQRALRQAGGRWDAEARLWWVPLHAVLRLGHEERIVRWKR